MSRKAMREALAALTILIVTCSAGSGFAQAEQQSWQDQLWADQLIPESEFAERCGQSFYDFVFGEKSSASALLADRRFLIYELQRHAPHFYSSYDNSLACCETALLAVEDRHEGGAQDVYSGFAHLHCLSLPYVNLSIELINRHAMAARRDFIRATNDPGREVAALIAYRFSQIVYNARPGATPNRYVPNLDAIVRWLADQVELGNSYALIGMAAAYEKGVGVAKDLEKARALLAEARRIRLGEAE